MIDLAGGPSDIQTLGLNSADGDLRDDVHSLGNGHTPEASVMMEFLACHPEQHSSADTTGTLRFPFQASGATNYVSLFTNDALGQ